MDQQVIQSIVEEVVNQLMKNHSSQKSIPIAVSARHCHLSKTDLEALFGEGFELTKKTDLYQPGQFSANETVTIIGTRGGISNVRILGPTRNLTQVEISKTDAIKLGLNPPM
jgi:putative phosphotransacetylase